MTAAQLAALVGGRLVGDASAEIDGVAPLDRAGPSEVSFFSNPKYRDAARRSGAGVILASSPEGLEGRSVVVCDNAYAALARVLEHFHPPRSFPAGVHGTAVIEPGARVDATASIGAFAVVGEGSAIGAGTRVDAGCVIGDRCRIGCGSRLYPRVVLYDSTVVGDRVILHAGAVVGSDGFGYAQEKGRHVKVPQVGTVVIEDDVEIGANTTIDRGALEETRIGAGTKIDNLVQIGHNVSIGPHCILVSQSGLSGSTRLGHHVMIAGQSGAVGHITIGDRARVGAKSAVTHDVAEDAFVTGHPAQDHRRWLRERALSGRLEEMLRRIKRLEGLAAPRAENEGDS